MVSQPFGQFITASVRAGNCRGSGAICQDQGISFVVPSLCQHTKTICFLLGRYHFFNRYYFFICLYLHSQICCFHTQNLSHTLCLAASGIKIAFSVQRIDSQLFEKLYGIRHRKLCKSLLYKLRMFSSVCIFRHCQICIITSAISCSIDFFSRFFILFQNGHSSPISGCHDSGHQSGSPCSHNDYMFFLHNDLLPAPSGHIIRE